MLYLSMIDGKLVGVLSLRDLIVAESDAYIEDIMNERVISVNASTTKRR